MNSLASRSIIWWIDHLGPGGAQEDLAVLTESLSTYNVKQTVVCLNRAPSQDFLDRIQKNKVTVHVIGKKRLFLLVGFVDVLTLLNRKSFDISVSCLLYADLLGNLFSYAKKIPVRITSQVSSNRHYSFLQRLLLRAVLTSATDVVLNSRTYLSFAKEYLPPKVPIHVISNGVKDVKKSRIRKGLRLPAMLDLPEDSIFIGSVGRLSPEKRLRDLISALASISDERIHLVLVGDGPEKEFLQSAAVSENVSSRVHFTGYVEDVRSIFDSLSLFILSSSFEGMSNSLLEAMAAGCPVAVSEIDGNLELVTNWKTGRTFSVGDIKQIANIIDYCLSRPNQSEALAKLGQEYVLSNYNEEKFLRSWRALLNVKLEQRV